MPPKAYVHTYLDFTADDECHLPRPDLRCDDHVALAERRRLEEGQHHPHEPGHLRAVQREEPGVWGREILSVLRYANVRRVTCYSRSSRLNTQQQANGKILLKR